MELLTSVLSYRERLCKTVGVEMAMMRMRGKTTLQDAGSSRTPSVSLGRSVSHARVDQLGSRHGSYPA